VVASAICRYTEWKTTGTSVCGRRVVPEGGNAVLNDILLGIIGHRVMYIIIIIISHNIIYYYYYYYANAVSSTLKRPGRTFYAKLLVLGVSSILTPIRYNKDSSSDLVSKQRRSDVWLLDGNRIGRNTRAWFTDDDMCEQGNVQFAEWLQRQFYTTRTREVTNFLPTNPTSKSKLLF